RMPALSGFAAWSGIAQWVQTIQCAFPPLPGINCLVSNALPTVTIVIPTRPGQEVILAVEASRGLDYPREQLQVIVARGRQPAVQRNAALKVARGELVYFLDDDARPLPDSLRKAVSHFACAEVSMVGGPNLCPPDAP